MTLLTHAATGFLVGKIEIVFCPALAESVGEGLFLLMNVHAGHYLDEVSYFAIQIALHLIEDMLDGSYGIYYLQ